MQNKKYESCALIKFPMVLILLPLITFSTFLALLVTPALPQIAIDFGISGTLAQWTILIFMVGYSVGQLPYGPIANRFGRKKAISIGVLIALLGTLLAYFAHSFWLLCAGRFIQAVGSAVGLKIAFTMVGDVHCRHTAIKSMCTVTMAFGIMPGIAAAIGGYITTVWNWQDCFLFHALYILGLWGLTLVLPETAKTLYKDALDPKKVIKGFAHEFKEPSVVQSAFFTGLSTSVLYMFATISPYISIDLIGLSPYAFGLWSIVPYLGMFIGSFISRFLSEINSSRVNMFLGLLVVLLGSAVLSVYFTMNQITVWSLFIPMFFVYLGCNLIWTNAASNGLEQASDKSNASAVIQFINVSTATVAVLLVEVVPPTTPMLLPVTLGVVTFLMIATWLVLKKSRKH